jgi:hypothetical protein
VKRTLDFTFLERLSTNNKSLWSFFMLSISMFDVSKEHEHNCQDATSFVTHVKNIISFLKLLFIEVFHLTTRSLFDYNHTPIVLEIDTKICK